MVSDSGPCAAPGPSQRSLGLRAALHVPGARRIVDVVAIGVRAKRLTRVEDIGHAGCLRLSGKAHAPRSEREIKVVLGHPGAQVGARHVLAPGALCISKVEGVDAELVGHRHIRIVGHALGDPMVTAHSLEPPDFVHVGEGDAVHLVGAVAGEKLAQALDALAGRADVGQHEGDHVLLADTARNLGLIALLALRAAGGTVDDERVGTEHALVGGDGLGRGHGHVGLVDARRGPDAVTGQRIGHAHVAHRLLGELNRDVRLHRLVGARLLLGLDDVHLLGLKLPAGRVLVAGDDGRAVVARCLTDQDRGTCHKDSYLWFAPGGPPSRPRGRRRGFPAQTVLGFDASRRILRNSR